jgi:hypothetical protein
MRTFATYPHRGTEHPAIGPPAFGP